MKARDLVENLFNFRPSGMDFDKAVQRVVMHVQTYLGDVVGEETTEDVAREECWTLAIDRANELSNDRQTAIRVAKEACHRVGYTPKGYRPAKRKPVQPVWPPQTADEMADKKPEPQLPKPTGVKHGPANRRDILGF